MSLLSTPDTLSLSLLGMGPSSETPVLMTLEYDDYPDPELPACSLCLTLNTSEYCHHTGQPHEHFKLECGGGKGQAQGIDLGYWVLGSDVGIKNENKNLNL